MDVHHDHTCVECSKKYSNISNLRRHVKKFHRDKDYLASLQLRKNKQYNFACDKCNRRFMHLKNFTYHAKKTHRRLNENIPDIAGTTKRNTCALCNNFCADKKTIVEHYRQFHSIPIKHKNLVFQSEKEFVTWKRTFENDTNSKYVLNSRKCYKSHVSTEFVCHRSGRYVSEGKNIRRLKMQGSVKINALCPASIKIKKLNSGVCTVTTIEKHVGHNGHLNLSKKGTLWNKLRIIRCRHKNSLSLNTDLVVECKNGWNVASETTAELYLIRKNTEDCDCQLSCDECKICVHKFYCSCLDSSVKHNMCKHIHLLMRYITDTEGADDIVEAQESDTVDSKSNLIVVKEEPLASEAEAHLKQTSRRDKLTSTSFASKKQRVASLLEELQHTVCCTTSEEELDVVEKALVPIKHTLTALNVKHTKIIRLKIWKNEPQQ